MVVVVKLVRVRGIEGRDVIGWGCFIHVHFCATNVF